MEVIQKGYGEVRLVGSDGPIAGEITLHAEGWVALVPAPSSQGESRWFPTYQVAEVIWRKSMALRPPKPQPRR